MLHNWTMISTKFSPTNSRVIEREWLCLWCGALCNSMEKPSADDCPHGPGGKNRTMTRDDF